MKQVLATTSILALLLAGPAFAQKNGAPAGQSGTGANVQVQQPPAHVTIQQPAPHVTVAQPTPQVSVKQPKPEVTVNQPKPDVTVQQAQPSVTMKKQKPEVSVIQQQKPQVATQHSGANAEARQDLARPEATTVKNLIGKTVYTKDGSQFGHIKNLLVGRDSRVQAAVIQYGGGVFGIGEHQIAVAWNKLNVQGDHVATNMTAKQLKSAPQWNKDHPGRFADDQPLH